MKQVVIIGAGGFGREVLDVVDACNEAGATYDPLGYVVDAQYAAPGTIVNDKPILGGFEWLERNAKDVLVTCGVGASHERYQLIQRAIGINCRFLNLVHPRAILTRWVTMGEGVIITAGCIMTNQIRIGNHVHINLDCTIGHDVILQDFVTLAPGVHVSGKITVGTGCYVGTGAAFVERVQIGEWSVVGAGSVVVGDVPANSTVVGVPARVIKTREPGWHQG